MVLHLRWTNFHTAKANPAAATARPPIMRVSAENRVDTVMPVNARAKPTKISKIPWRDFSGPDSRLLKLATITRTAIETTARKRNRGAIIVLSVVRTTRRVVGLVQSFWRNDRRIA